MWKFCLLLIILAAVLALSTSQQDAGFLLPVAVTDRSRLGAIELTPIGAFGLKRKARPGIPAHLHTGVDIRRPTRNYFAEPIFPLAAGQVISMRDNGPYAQLIIEHTPEEGRRLWTVYEHTAGIRNSTGDPVNPHQPMARFMHREELNRYGRQFDHFHFEILKTPPRPVPPDNKLPFRFFAGYRLLCYTPPGLRKHYFDPLEFLDHHLQ